MKGTREEQLSVPKWNHLVFFARAVPDDFLFETHRLAFLFFSICAIDLPETTDFSFFVTSVDVA